jgi:hypothetical protein
MECKTGREDSLLYSLFSVLIKSKDSLQWLPVVNIILKIESQAHHVGYTVSPHCFTLLLLVQVVHQIVKLLNETLDISPRDFDNVALKAVESKGTIH